MDQILVNFAGKGRRKFPFAVPGHPVVVQEFFRPSHWTVCFRWAWGVAFAHVAWIPNTSNTPFTSLHLPVMSFPQFPNILQLCSTYSICVRPLEPIKYGRLLAPDLQLVSPGHRTHSAHGQSPDAGDNVTQAMEVYGATRIGHGYRSLGTEAMTDRRRTTHR